MQDDRTTFQNVVLSCCHDMDYKTLLSFTNIAIAVSTISKDAKEVKALTDEERAILAAYRKSGDEIKRAVRSVLQVELPQKEKQVLSFMDFAKK